MKDPENLISAMFNLFMIFNKEHIWKTLYLQKIEVFIVLFYYLV